MEDIRVGKNGSATGRANFVKQRFEGIVGIFASPVGAADRVYFVGRNGKTQVIKLSEKFQVLATNTLDDNFDCSPAFTASFSCARLRLAHPNSLLSS